MGHADHITNYAEPPAAALLKRADLLAQKVAIVERAARAGLFRPAGRAADVPFTVRVTMFHGQGSPAPGTLRAFADAYLRLSHRRMVVTGVAGAGKTVLTLELVLLLLERREPWDPVPVRVPLAEWDSGTPLESWLVRRVADTYGLATHAAQDLVAQRLVLPVLDGLDEMDGVVGSSERAAHALSQINRYHGLRGPAPLVVTCRAETYERLSRERGGLESAAVARIEELDTSQIRAYLENVLAARSDAERHAWREVIGNLDRLPAGALSTPWRLYLATTVYSGGRDPRDMLTLTNLAEVDRLLLERLIPVAAETTPHRRYTAERTMKWLSSLAHHPLEPAATESSGAQVADILLHRLAFVVGLKRVMAIQFVAATLVGALSYVAWVFRDGFWATGWALVGVAGIGLAWAALLAALALRKTVEPMRFVRLRFAPRLAWRLLRLELRQEWWDYVRRGERRTGRLLKKYGLFFACTTPLVTVLWKWGASAPWSLSALIAAATAIWVMIMPILGWLLYALFSPLILFIGLSIQHADSLPVRRPGDLLRQDIAVSALIFGAVFPWALLWPTAALVPLLIIPMLVSRAWARYLISALVGAARGLLPLRPAPFLAWAHQAGLMRVTGRSYQFRHRALQQWLRNEFERQMEVKRLTRDAEKRSLSDVQRLEAAARLTELDAVEGLRVLASLSANPKVGLRQRIMAMEASAVLHAERGEIEEYTEELTIIRQFAEVPLLEADSYEYRWATDALIRLDPPVGRHLLTRIIDGAMPGKGSREIQEWAAATLAQLDP
ncbi:NACHT domain-containing protein [Streptomyces sp. NPDC059631]|uniref:NACHT domain-containing protein n=1 Tax=unclassified Streptomyces TaxID=2593676 RepID=UPI0036B83F61